MSAEITIDVSEVLEKIDPKKMRGHLEAAVGGAADIIRADMKRYPGRQSTGPQQWKSERQRRWFFAALRSGQIRIPYRRTGTLGRGWTKHIKRGAKWPSATIGTHVAYAPYVQSKERQAPMHARNRWSTAQDVVRERADDVKRFIEQALRKWAK